MRSMRILRDLALGVALCVTAASASWAQGSNDQVRPGSSTTMGDTGLWFVPIAETMPKGKWSGGLQRVDINRSEGFTNVEDIGGMFAFGATDKIEVFGAFSRRGVDADLISPRLTALGQPQDYLINQGWTDGFGDILAGAKFNLRSQVQNDGVAFGARVAVNLPTAGDGMGTGKTAFTFDLIGSREFSQKVDLSAQAGFKLRTSPDGYALTNGFTWGVGAGYPSRSKFKVIGEMTGEAVLRSQSDIHGRARSGHAARAVGRRRHARYFWRPPIPLRQRLLHRRGRELRRLAPVGSQEL